MKPDQRRVTQLPLPELWNEDGPIDSERQRHLSPEEVREFLRNGPVRFVIASVGEKPNWIPQESCFDFWKEKAAEQICAPDLPIELENFPSQTAYLASLWSSETPPPIIVLEVHH